VHAGDCATCATAAKRTPDLRRTKKTPLARGVGRLLVWRSVFSLLSGFGAVSGSNHPDPRFLESLRSAWLACFPKVRHAPLMDIYEQQPCQKRGFLPRCDIFCPGWPEDVIQSPLAMHFRDACAHNEAPLYVYNSRENRELVKRTDTSAAPRTLDRSLAYKSSI
jgi:hypothetical protein